MSMNEFKHKELMHLLTVMPFSYTIFVIGGKWKMIVMFWLVEGKGLRYGQLKRLIGQISNKILNEQLKELEQDGIFTRKGYSQIPPKVEWLLTERGGSLTPILDAICQ